MIDRSLACALFILSCCAVAGLGPALAESTVSLEPGQIHVDYPKVKSEATAGQFILAPGRVMLERAVERGRTGTFIYYGGTLVEVGPVESRVRTLAGQQFSLPNSLIVPIPAGHQAARGEVLLGHWQSGSGLRRAIVTGGTPEAPVVRYLDGPFNQEKADQQKEDTFQAGRFTPLTAAWQIGTTLACSRGNRRQHGVLVHDSNGDQVLVLLHAGQLEPRPKRDCIGLPPSPTVAEGDSVFVPVAGNFTPGTVTQVSAAIGRVWVRYTFGGQERLEAFSIVDVARSLDP